MAQWHRSSDPARYGQGLLLRAMVAAFDGSENTKRCLVRGLSDR